MSRRADATRAYLTSLVVQYEALEAERQRLLQAAGRITEIQAEKADLIADAQEALDKYNALEGTSYTLTQVRKWFNNTTGVPVFATPTPEIP